MKHEREWIVAGIKIISAGLAIMVLTVRAVYGAETSPLPDGLTGPALISAALVYMAKAIYELTVKRKDESSLDQPKLNAAAWQMLVEHMHREEGLFDKMTQAQDRVAQALTQLALKIEK